MGFFCLCMMRIALELARENRAYETMATKFFEHFVYIGGAMKKMGGRNYQLWDEEDGFFYDVLRYPDGRFHKFEVRSLVGLIPLYAIDMIDEDEVSGLPVFLTDVKWFIRNRPDLVGQACFTDRVDGKRAARAVDRRSPSAREAAAAHLGSGRVPVGGRHPQPLEVSRDSIRSRSAAARCATSRPKRTSRSRAATRTGADRSGSRRHSC